MYLYYVYICKYLFEMFIASVLLYYLCTIMIMIVIRSSFARENHWLKHDFLRIRRSKRRDKENHFLRLLDNYKL